MNSFYQEKPLPIKHPRHIVTAVVLAVMFAVFAAKKADMDIISSVRNGCLQNYSETTINDAFEQRFGDCEWSLKKDSPNNYVIFTGYDQQTLSDWKVIFKVRDHNFKMESITVDQTTYTDLDANCLLDYIYTGNADMLLGYAFLSALFS